MSKEMREQIDRVKNWKQFLNENKTEYKEIEFVCHNSDSETSTDKNLQNKLYDDLKKLEVESGFKIKPYMQDFCEGSHIELSLAVIILDKQNEKYWEKQIMMLVIPEWVIRWNSNFHFVGQDLGLITNVNLFDF
jgi:hypothetical protein